MDIKQNKKQKKSIKEILLSIPLFIKESIIQVSFLIRFFILLFFVSIKYLLYRTPRRKLNKPDIVRKPHSLRKNYDNLYKKVLKVFDTNTPSEIKNSDLILLAMKNLSMKRNRTYVTIGGMAIGFGAVILLLSLGYGFEKLVVSQVASLSEMKQIDISASKGSPLVFNKDVIDNISGIEKVKTVIPIVTSVSKITYNNAVSDVIVYGVSSEYFIETGISPILGNTFSDDTQNINSEIQKESIGEVAGVDTVLISKKEIDEEVYKINYSINPTVWKTVYSEPDMGSKIIGYTKREPGKQSGSEVWGDSYSGDNVKNANDIEGKEYSTWVKGSFPIWERKDCGLDNPKCFDSQYIVSLSPEGQVIEAGYITEESVVIDRYELTKGSPLEIYTGKSIDDIKYQLKSSVYINLYLDSNKESVILPVLGIDSSKYYNGTLVYGKTYGDGTYTVKSSNGREYGYWIETNIQLWHSIECEKFCNEYTTYKKDDDDKAINTVGYFMISDVIVSENINELVEGKVLGTENTSSFIDLEDLMEEEDDSIDWVNISTELGTLETVKTDIKEIPESAQRVILVNTAMLNLLAIEESKAVGEKITAKIIFDNKLFNKDNYVIESEDLEVEIAGVISDNKSPSFYIPISDIMVDGMENVSSIKIVVKDTGDVAGVRESIESMGFHTASVVDTVDSINELFGTLRIALLILGLIALGVASLGMFNTLTVSLLEKTREVGLLKTMGLKSKEVKTLFLAESLVISVVGGFAGLSLGFIIGKLISLFISILAIAQGRSAIDVAHIPIILAISLILVSAIVGVLTGWYPAERAKKISALNALRYE